MPAQIGAANEVPPAKCQPPVLVQGPLPPLLVSVKQIT